MLRFNDNEAIAEVIGVGFSCIFLDLLIRIVILCRVFTAIRQSVGNR